MPSSATTRRDCERANPKLMRRICWDGVLISLSLEKKALCSIFFFDHLMRRSTSMLWSLQVLSPDHSKKFRQNSRGRGTLLDKKDLTPS